MHVTVLGPQRRPTLDAVVRDLGVDGPIATITSGWQERESDDGELDALLGGRSVNLGLYGRRLDVLERDTELAAANLDQLAIVDELRQQYLVQLDHALKATYEVAQRASGRPRTREAAIADALAVVRLVDDNHMQRVRDARAAFYDAWQPHDRTVVAEHRAEVRRVLEQSRALVVAGGHVGMLVRTLHLFNVAPSIPPVVVAWSAGAMAMTERVVLFHDRTPSGPSPAEVYDDGIGVLRDLVLLPHARRRLQLDDPVRMSVLARRLAPARCVVLDDGARLDLGEDGFVPTDAKVVSEDGAVGVLEPA